MRVMLASVAAFAMWCVMTSDALAGVPPSKPCRKVTIHATVKFDRTTYVIRAAILCPDKTLMLVGRQQGQ